MLFERRVHFGSFRANRTRLRPYAI
jgi:hypothetical protein